MRHTYMQTYLQAGEATNFPDVLKFPGLRSPAIDGVSFPRTDAVANDLRENSPPRTSSHILGRLLRNFRSYERWDLSIQPSFRILGPLPIIIF